VEVSSIRVGSRATRCILGLVDGVVLGRSLGLANHDRSFGSAHSSEPANGDRSPETVRTLMLANGCRIADAARNRLLLRRGVRWLEQGRLHDTRPAPGRSIYPAV